ncbi:MAG: GntR family transcriptional regulator [Nocardioidaceae bacterium]
MSVQVKHTSIAAHLSRDILRGVLEPGERLPGEHELAARFEVSRGTVRQALARLQDDGLIEKHAGAGSFVAFDGHQLDDRLGWAQALERHGVRTTVEVLRLQRCSLTGLAGELRLPNNEFLALDRRRRLPTGEVVSLERSRLPWREGMHTVVRDGLQAGSLTTTLTSLDLKPAGWAERVELVWLTAEDARGLEARPRDPYLSCVRVAYLGDGQPLEHVTNLLDPHHFRLESRHGYVP